MIFWGPPGVGKTTLARIIAGRTKASFIDFSAVTSGIREIRAVMTKADENVRFGEKTIVFVDEIHRFNKAQQDAFLPFVEKGSIILIGATTENPSFEVNGALLSRCKVFVLQPLETEDLVLLLRRALDDAGDELQAYAPLGAGEALALSGALSVVQADEDVEAVNDLLADAFSGALEQLQAMRQAEGEHLSRDLLNNLDALEALRESIARRAPEVPLEYRRRLEARLEEWLAEPADPQRVAQEVALMADHCAIDEELSRLQSHIAQFRSSVENGTEVGRKLDFLVQEFNREANTISSKSQDIPITRAALEMKSEIEKLREQLQNVE